VATIIGVHSFRGGTGESSSTASRSALTAAHGRRVGDIHDRVRTYGCDVAVLSQSDDLMRLGSEGVVSLRNPDQPLTAQYRALARHVLP